MANEEFILELLKRIQADTAETRRRVENIDVRLSANEDYLRGMLTAIGGI